MTIKIPLMKSAFLNEEATREALANFVRSAERFSMGQRCRAFEDEFAGYQGFDKNHIHIYH